MRFVFQHLILYIYIDKITRFVSVENIYTLYANAFFLHYCILTFYFVTFIWIKYLDKLFFTQIKHLERFLFYRLQHFTAFFCVNYRYGYMTFIKIKYLDRKFFPLEKELSLARVYTAIYFMLILFSFKICLNICSLSITF